MFITNLIRQQRARHHYWKASTDANAIIDDLWRVGSYYRRYELLDDLSNCQASMGLLHTPAWGLDPNPDEGGRDVAESILASSALAHALAVTERELANLEETDPEWVDPWLDHIDRAELALWSKLATVYDRNERATLIDQIYGFAADRVGGQAAEILLTVAATERHFASGAPAPARSKDRFTGHAIIAAALLTGFALVELPDLLSLIH